MARRIISAIVSSLKDERPEEVHFHTDGGRPYVCHDRRCGRPRFDAG